MPSASLNPSRAPLVGGILRIRLSERESRTKLPQDLLKEALSDKAETCERILNLALSVHWEVGEAGAGGGLSAGNDMESSGLVIVSAIQSPLGEADRRTPRTSASAISCTQQLDLTLLTSPVFMPILSYHLRVLPSSRSIPLLWSRATLIESPCLFEYPYRLAKRSLPCHSQCRA